MTILHALINLRPCAVAGLESSTRILAGAETGCRNTCAVGSNVTRLGARAHRGRRPILGLIEIIAIIGVACASSLAAASAMPVADSLAITSARIQQVRSEEHTSELQSRF